MTALQQLKEQFTAITGLPAKKVMVEAVCAPTLRAMRTKSDWQWAVSAILPRFRTGEEKPVAAPEITSLDDLAQLLSPEDAALFFQFLFAVGENLKDTYRRLSKKYHPDTSTAPNAQLLFPLIHEQYQQAQNNGNHQTEQEDNWEATAEYNEHGVLQF